MQKIKFRAWYHHKGNHDNGWMEYLDIGINKLYQNKFILSKSVPAYTNGYYVPLNNFKHDKDFAFMQFTGLCDETGEEIYEGDIVKCTDEADEIDIHDSDTGIGIIEWNNEYAFWSISKIENGLGDILHKGYVKIIGNIHEHPELIPSEI